MGFGYFLGWDLDRGLFSNEPRCASTSLNYGDKDESEPIHVE